ncbi:uncharacterized protein LOC121238254 [Juglans microcarpa x Juglans regia]|uniref:uncharacterized protein LOC121238254 n=1 Tax=Juglans microcarpa x Juglans regia TaxID=2249226 RepID=UPI001B7F61C5|nr:uncharacterized protein LOC121238254 [Juglans microcarpa x Juglans regia]
MEDDLHVLYTKMSLTEKEGEGVVVDTGDLENVLPSGKRCFFMKLFTEKYFNKEAFIGTMRKVWRTAMGVRFQELSPVLFLVEFENGRDKTKVLREGPWLFDKHLVLLKKMDGRLQVQQVQMTMTSFWVRFHDLPLMAMNVFVGKKLGERLGSIEEVDLEKGEVEWGEYLRVQVTFNVTEPLLRGAKLSIGGGESVWIHFSYERLPNFCYWCGRVGHTDKDCAFRTRDSEVQKMVAQPYGVWLRAGSFTERTNQGRFRASGGGKMGHPSGVRGGPGISQPKVASMQREGRSEDTVVGGGSDSAGKGRDGEDSPVTDTELMAPVNTEVGDDVQGEVGGTAEIGVLKDTFHVTDARVVGGDNQFVDELGLKR